MFESNHWFLVELSGWLSYGNNPHAMKCTSSCQSMDVVIDVVGSPLHESGVPTLVSIRALNYTLYTSYT